MHLAATVPGLSASRRTDGSVAARRGTRAIMRGDPICMSELEPPDATAGAGPPLDPLSDEDCARLRAQLVKAVARVCPSWLSAQAEDIAQAALIRVVEIIRRREGKEGLNSSYLWKAAHSATGTRPLANPRAVTLRICLTSSPRKV